MQIRIRQSGADQCDFIGRGHVKRPHPPRHQLRQHHRAGVRLDRKGHVARKPGAKLLMAAVQCGGSVKLHRQIGLRRGQPTDRVGHRHRDMPDKTVQHRRLLVVF